MHVLYVHVQVHDCMHSIPNPQQKAELKRIRLGQIPIWLLASSGAQEKGSEGRSGAREGRVGRDDYLVGSKLLRTNFSTANFSSGKSLHTHLREGEGGGKGRKHESNKV